jgi:hypothetical protein
MAFQNSFIIKQRTHVTNVFAMSKERHRQAGMMKLIVVFWNLAKAPDKIKGLWISVGFHQFAGWHLGGDRVIEYPSCRFCHIL